ncbi:hypothetical protein GCM10011392_25910 [Wenxinia marina]|nr:hypothetical protein GCM10011392_25910 [Wenxinia marina]
MGDTHHPGALRRRSVRLRPDAALQSVPGVPPRPRAGAPLQTDGPGTLEAPVRGRGGHSLRAYYGTVVGWVKPTIPVHCDVGASDFGQTPRSGPFPEPRPGPAPGPRSKRNQGPSRPRLKAGAGIPCAPTTGPL